MTMSIIAWILLGLIAGVVDKSLLGDRAEHGAIVTIPIGIAGALLGGWVAANVLRIDTTGGFFDVTTWIIAIVGSAVLLVAYHAVAGLTRRSASGRPRR